MRTRNLIMYVIIQDNMSHIVGFEIDRYVDEQHEKNDENKEDNANI